MRPLILLLPILAQSAILETCLRYFTNIELQKSTCIECRDGYFLKNNLCVECNRIIKNAQCTSTKAFNYGSNIVTFTPLSPSNNNINITNMTNMNPDSKAPNLVSLQNKTISHTNNTNNTLKKQNDSAILTEKNSTKGNQTKLEPDPGVALGKLNPLSATGMSTPSKLQNCKEVSTGKCAKCFLGYDLKNELCVKKKKDENKMQNCFVFSQIESQCVMCEDGYEVGDEGYCQSPSAVNQPQKITTVQQTASNKTEFMYAQAEAVSAIQNIQPDETESANLFNNSNTAVGSKPKIHLAQSHIEIIPTNSSSTFRIERSFKLANTSETNSSGAGLLVKERQKNTVKPMITLEGNNDSFIIKIGEEEGCQEYDKNNGKDCIKCMENYLLNPLMHKCMNINKPIDLGKPSSINTRVSTPLQSTLGKAVQNGSASTIASKAQAQTQVQSGQETPTTTTITIIVNNGNANSVINISTNSAKPVIENGNPIVISTSSDLNNNRNTAPLNNAGNITNSNFSSTVNMSSVNINSSQIKSVHNATNATANSSSGNGAIILAKTTSLSTPSAPAQLRAKTSITQVNSSIPTNASVKTSGASSCSINKCVKCKEMTNECSQCEPTYQLYLGKCYDTFSYRLIIKSKMYGQSI